MDKGLAVIWGVKSDNENPIDRFRWNEVSIFCFLEESCSGVGGVNSDNTPF